MDQITDFRSEPYRFLSNMYPCKVRGLSRIYECAEAAYQAAKCFNESDRERFVGIDGYAAKRLGRTVDCRPDWDEVKVEVMRRVLRVKFAPGSALAQRLLQTAPAELIEGNTWNDTFWGVCRGRGQNLLGKLLMEQRDLLQRQIER